MTLAEAKLIVLSRMQRWLKDPHYQGGYRRRSEPT